MMNAAKQQINFAQRPEPLDALNPAGCYITPLREYPQSPMDKQTSQMFMAMTLNFADETNVNATGLRADLEKQFTYKVLEARLKAFDLDVAFNVKAFLAISFPSPGKLVLFVHSIFHSQRRVPGQQYTMTDFSYDFAMGFPDEQVMEFAWDAQKIKQGDNGIDLDFVFRATKEAPYIEPPKPGTVEA